MLVSPNYRRLPFICTLLAAAVAFAGLAIAKSPTPLAEAEAEAPPAPLPVADPITVDELAEHVNVLADDVYEGRLAGSRGGRAAGQYIVQQLRNYPVKPAGTEGEYFQDFDKGSRNILVLWPGSDAKLRDEVIVVGAHYDHVGDGSRGHILGKKGVIYNGADDNASGVSILLETIETISTTPIDTRRSILFAFWDAEELGLLGSTYWLEHPTIPLERIRLAVNIDMVGRLRDDTLYVLATRTGYGLRQMCSGPVAGPLRLDFSWDLQPNGDHWPFIERGIPVAMLHTGLHEDYHRPTDDVEQINHQGMQLVGQYLLGLVTKLADADELPAFREAGIRETEARQERVERPLPRASLDRWPRRLPVPRMGISWREDDGEPGTVYVTRVVGGTPADEAGLEVHDRIQSINGQSFASDDEFRKLLSDLLDSGAPAIKLTVETEGRLQSVTVELPPAEEEPAAKSEE